MLLLKACHAYSFFTQSQSQGLNNHQQGHCNWLCYLSNLTSYFSLSFLPSPHWHLCCTLKPPVTPIPWPLLLQVPRYPCGTLPHPLQFLVQHHFLSEAPTILPHLLTLLTLPSSQHFALSNVLCNLFIDHICCLSPPLILSERISIKFGTEVRKAKTKQKPGFQLQDQAGEGPTATTTEPQICHLWSWQ